MPNSPYARILASVDGGSFVAGSQDTSIASTVQLKAESTVGWIGSPLWEIYEYPDGFATPAGWTLAASGSIQSTDVQPQPFDMDPWGKYLTRLTVENGLLNGVYSGVDAVQPLVNEAGFECTDTPGIRDTAYLEGKHFDPKAYIQGFKDNWRTISDFIKGGGGGGSSVTGTGLWYSVAGTLQAAAATLGDLAVVGGALKVAALSSASVIAVATGLSYGSTLVASNGFLRIPKSTYLAAARNAGNTADSGLIGTDGADKIVIGGSASTLGVTMYGVGATVAMQLSASITDFLALGSNPASGNGMLRVSSGQTAVGSRNNANSGNIPLLGTDASDNVNVGDVAGTKGALTVLNSVTGVSFKVGGVQVGSLAAADSDTLKLGVGATVAKLAANDHRFYVGATAQTVFLKIWDGGVGWCQFDINNSWVVNATGLNLSVGASGTFNCNSGVSNTNQFAVSMSGSGAGLGGVPPALGSATNTLSLFHATTSPTAAAAASGAIWNDAIGLHYVGANSTSANFLDYMIAPVLQGTPNTQKMIVRSYCGVARTTTNAAVTILTIPLATATSNGGISVVVEGRDVTSGTVGDGVTIQQVFQFKNVAGTVTQGATLGTPLKANDTSMAACTCTATVSGTNILVQVTGLSSVTIDWTAIGEAITN